MSAHIRTKNRVLEPCKKVITPELFKELLEARKFAVARSAAKAHLKRLEELQLYASQPMRLVPPTGSSQGSESRHEDGQEAKPLHNSRSGNGAAAAMEVDSQHQEEVLQRKRDLKRFVKRQKAEADRLKRDAEKSAREAERKLQWAAAEQERVKRLSEIEMEQKEAAEKAKASQLEIESLRLKTEPLNEQKAKLVAQLKQVLQAEEPSRTRPASNLEDGEMMHMTPRVSTGSALAMDSNY